MLASFPASMLNQKIPDLGILNRFKLEPSRSRRQDSRQMGFLQQHLDQYDPHKYKHQYLRNRAPESYELLNAIPK